MGEPITHFTVHPVLPSGILNGLLARICVLPIVTLMFVSLSKVYSPITLYYAMLSKNQPKINFTK